MDLGRVLEQLRAELQHLDAAILSLERLHQSVRRRGRPPSGLAGGDEGGRPKRGRGSGPRDPNDGKKSG